MLYLTVWSSVDLPQAWLMRANHRQHRVLGAGGAGEQRGAVEDDGQPAATHDAIPAPAGATVDSWQPEHRVALPRRMHERERVVLSPVRISRSEPVARVLA
jgi:hypothetical protein